MNEIKVAASACIRCGRCAAVCPSYVFDRAEDGTITVPRAEDCIVCGHCAAVCPVDALSHSAFPPERLHRVDRAELPSADQLEELICSRRSNRGFNGKDIPMEYLDRILEAAHRAPTASNAQGVAFTLITNREEIRRISAFTLKVFAKLEKLLTFPLLMPVLRRIMPGAYKYVPKFRFMIGEFAKGRDFILRDAAAVILIHTPSGSRFGKDDANLAYQNASLMAEALGVSQFYTGFVCTAVHQSKGELEKMFGIEGTIQAGMALGMPRFTFPKYMDKKDIVVRKFL